MESITRSEQVQEPFTLSCYDCDAGMEHDTPEKAIAAGWTSIIFDPDGAAWRFLGLCPTCAARIETQH